MMKPQASVAPASGAKGGEIIVGYSNRTWVCPYFKWDEKTKIHCECGILCFCDNKELGEYAGKYCSDFGWGSCTLARNRNRHYEKQNAQKGKLKEILRQSLRATQGVEPRKQGSRGKPAFRGRGETADKAKLLANSKNEQKGEA